MRSTEPGASPPLSSWQTWRREPSNWIALFTLLAILVYTGVQIWQTSLIRSNNIVSQRAFVYVGSTFTPISATSAENRAPIIEILLPLINGGNTPTKHFHFLYRCAPSVDPLPEPWVLLYQGTPEYIPDVLGPRSSTAMGCNFTVAQLLDMQAGRLHGYVMADIFYEDTLEPGNVHRTQYCREVVNVNFLNQSTAPNAPPATNTPNTPNTPSISNIAQLFATLIPRGQHNCTDDDCPR